MVNNNVFMTLFLFLFLFGFLNLPFIQKAGMPLSPVMITGYAINTTGIVDILIEGPELIVTIYSPENITYNFNKSDPYIIDLNVSADFAIDNESTDWKYSLNGGSDTTFTPNSSITADRWVNSLTVSAKYEGGGWGSETVIFYVNVSNSAPLLGVIDNPIFVCEGEKLAYNFNATDVDLDDLDGDISPRNPFYVESLGRTGNTSFFNITSGILNKDDVRNHSETISVVDSDGLVDTNDTIITVIEINNPPVMTGLGAQTVWLTGDNSTFYYQMVVDDVEDGNTSGGLLEFNLTWSASENFFDIGSSDGIMNYTPLLGHEGNTYSLTVCVEDNALSSIHSNISLCAPRDGDVESVCDSFSLTVTNENRAPTIINYTPINNSFSVSGTSSSDFFVEVYDADGTIPDIDWYVDGTLKEHNENISNDSYSYSFGCGVSGEHNITIITSDGLLSDSQAWTIDVSLVECPPPSSRGGSGPGGPSFCMEKWFCDNWDVCQNTEKSFEVKILSQENYYSTKEICAQNGYNEIFCGFQITECYDLNDCNNSVLKIPKSSEMRTCYFTENPSCYDKITNCHSGSCELLIDCGGPCNACATCSDKIENQGEEGIDCGGPCPFSCAVAKPIIVFGNILMWLSILLIIVIIYISYRIIKLLRKKRHHV